MSESFPEQDNQYAAAKERLRTAVDNDGGAMGFSTTAVR